MTTKALALANDNLIESLPSESAAWYEGFLQRRPFVFTDPFTEEEKSMQPFLTDIARACQYSPGNFSRFLNGQQGTPINRAAVICRTFGNVIPLQKICLTVGFKLYPVGYVENLQRKLDELEADSVLTERPKHIWASPVLS